MEKSLPDQRDVNIFLDVLRSSGKTNMFGAGPYIEKHFKVKKQEARELLHVWMTTFSDRKERGEVIE